ncbi:enoyl-CoA hydratase-related protein [Bradyrhizobium liaoningense]
MTLVINRPPVNAFSIGLLAELKAILDSLTERPDVHVVVIRAEGRGFCAGGDVKEVEELEGFQGILGQTAGSTGSIAVARCAVPVICAVHGYCIGVGVLIVGLADIILAAPQTRFVLAEIDNGATAGGVQALKLMPEKRARLAMMTAQPVYAEELLSYGTIASIAPAEELAAAASALAETIAAKHPQSMRRLKKSLNGVTGVEELETRYRSEISYTYELNLMGIASEGRSSFIEGTRGSYMKAGKT